MTFLRSALSILLIILCVMVIMSAIIITDFQRLWL